MKPKSCSATNFGSYAGLEFDFDNLGLASVSGPTGSGKSTVCDLISWCCFGYTSKNGAADDVRPWGCDEPTAVTLDVETSAGDIQVTRIRGKAAQNDLYWTEASDPETKVRGKDISETQKLLSKRLGVDAELFSLGSYFGQFSSSESFFTAKAKDRRAILERITDLSLPMLLSERASETRKVAKKELEALELAKAGTEGQLRSLKAQRAGIERDSERWETQQARLIVEAQEKAKGFESEKTRKANEIAIRLEELDKKIVPDESFTKRIEKTRTEQTKLLEARAKYQKVLPAVSDLKSRLNTAVKDKKRQEALPDVCPECNRPGANPNKHEHLAEAQRAIDDLNQEYTQKSKVLQSLEKELEREGDLSEELRAALQAQTENSRLRSMFDQESAAFQALDETVNVYADKAEELKKAPNPYRGQESQVEQSIRAVDKALSESVSAIAAKGQSIVSLSSIYDLSFVLRAELLRNVVADLENETNRRLEDFFDAEFRVSFALEDSDKLEVEITKNGYPCSFFQQSGGERRMMTLCFSIALMRAAESASGIKFSLKMFDEALNGLDDTLKIKAFRLFEELAEDTPSVILIDHSEPLKSMFTRQFTASKDGDNSVLAEGEIGSGSVEAA